MAPCPGSIAEGLEAASQLCLRGNAAAAVPLLDRLVEKHPDSVPLRATLGDVHYELGHDRVALECYEHVLDGHPEHLGCPPGAGALPVAPAAAGPEAALAAAPRGEPGGRRGGPRTADPGRRGAAARLARGRLAHARLAQARLALDASPTLLDDPLLLLVLRRAVLTDLRLEHALTQARRELCLAPPREAPELARALAEQCRLNESAWAISPEEEARLASAPEWVRAM